MIFGAHHPAVSSVMGNALKVRFAGLRLRVLISLEILVKTAVLVSEQLAGFVELCHLLSRPRNSKSYTGTFGHLLLLDPDT